MTDDKKENSISSGETNLYEVGFHIIPIVEEGELDGEVQKIKDILGKHQSRLIGDEQFPKLTTLAYKIPKKVGNKKQSFDKAYFGWIKFECLPEETSEIKKELDTLENILRFIIVHTVRSGKMIAKKVVIEKPSEEKVSEDKEKKVSSKGMDEAIDELVIE